ncbi:MAG: glucose-6-phosphate dehydrogenase assembly protein OpcA [Actinobacteria bacterium]|nr:glucose-6-phosphate dehydrogenase assembly protein OpcA [Actinomycetota bacterium]
MRRLDDTTAAKVAEAIDYERFLQGSSAVSRVLTLVIVADETTQADAVRAAAEAAREHPSRILVAIPRPGRGPARLDAEVMVGGADGLGELAELRLRGPLAHHVASVVLPLLVPDAPVVVWWPGQAPDVPAEDPVGRLAQRRITDAAATPRPLRTLQTRCEGYRDGDTDLAWTRLTPWRALLAANLDQPHDPLTGGTVSVQKGNPSGTLLAAWLQMKLGLPVDLKTSKGPGITAVSLHTAHGDITISRPDGGVALIERPGLPVAEAALHRRTTDGLIAEELRRLDPDEVYGETLEAVHHYLADPPAGPARARSSKSLASRTLTPEPDARPRTATSPATKSAATKSAATKSASKKAAAKRPATPSSRKASR